MVALRALSLCPSRSRPASWLAEDVTYDQRAGSSHEMSAFEWNGLRVGRSIESRESG